MAKYDYSKLKKSDLIEMYKEVEKELDEANDSIAKLEEEIADASNYDPSEHGYIEVEDAWNEPAEIISAFRRGDNEGAEILIARYAPKSIVYGG